MIVVANNDGPAAAIALWGAVTGLTIRDNFFAAPLGILALDPTAPEGLKRLHGRRAAHRKQHPLVPAPGDRFSGSVVHLLATGSPATTSGAAATRQSRAGSGLTARRYTSRTTAERQGRGIQCSLDFAWIDGNA